MNKYMMTDVLKDWKQKETLGNYMNEGDKFNVYENCSLKKPADYDPDTDIICYKSTDISCIWRIVQLIFFYCF